MPPYASHAPSWHATLHKPRAYWHATLDKPRAYWHATLDSRHLWEIRAHSVFPLACHMDHHGGFHPSSLQVPPFIHLQSVSAARPMANNNAAEIYIEGSWTEGLPGFTLMVSA